LASPRARRGWRLGSALLAGAAALLLAGCGSGGGTSGRQDATLLLDFTPNAVHSGIYTAVGRGYDEGEGVKLRVRTPGSSPDSVKLLLAGRTDLAVLDIHDLAIARQQGRDIVGVMALVQRPLAALLSRPGLREPVQLAGRRVGVTGLPSDDAVVRSIAAGAGVRAAGVKRVTIGFDAVSALLGGRVDAATAFWNVEGVELHRRRPGFNVFKVDQFGAPAYPELVLCTTRTTLRDSPELVGGTVRALVRGYQEVLDDPASGAEYVRSANRSLGREAINAQLDAVSPLFRAADGRIGELDPRVLQTWSRWEQRFGIVRKRPDVRAMFDGRFVNP
jgi:ABC-type nitrate/sulfonate/bicarbonate transport system substrate-binding protein